MNKVLRHALTGSAIATGMMIAASPAQAACPAGTTTNTNDSRICLTGTTTTTTNTTGLLATDRNALFFTETVPTFFTVQTGATINGAGAAWTQGGGGTNTTTVTNNGAIQVDAGVVPTAGGNGALSITSINAPVIYRGTGTVTNLGFGPGIDVNLTNVASLDMIVGGNVTSTNGGFAAIDVLQSGTSGNVRVETLTGTTLRGGSGIQSTTLATSTSSTTLVNAATVLSPTGAPNTLIFGVVGETLGSGAVTITNSGAIGTATDRALIGVAGFISNATNSATLNVSGTGAIFSSSDGVRAETQGTGNVVVNYTGAINTTGGDGIDADSRGGSLTVTGGAITTTGGNGIDATSTTGAIIINSNGAVSANAGGIVGTSTTGSITANVNANVTSGGNGVTLTSGNFKIVNVAAGTTVNSTGANDIAFNGGGINTVNNLGTIGGDTTGIAIAAPGSGATTINNGSATNATAVLNGRLSLSGNADTVNNRAVFNTQGLSDFSAGVDTFNNLTGGTLNIVGDTTFANLEAFNNTGRINLNNFTLTGTAGTPFVNGPGGFIDTSGSAGIIGFASLTNNGTIDLAAGTFTVPAGVFTNTATGIVLADEGATTITGQTSFVNSGVIDLQDGVRDDTLTINSNYSGSGRLQVDVSGTTSDLLIINGTTAGGTSIDVNVIGLGAFVPGGILVVDATGASLNSNTFIIGNETGNPLINFDVEQRGNDYFLVTLLDPETAFTPLAATGLMREMWYQSADEVFAHTLAPTNKLGFSVWGNVYGSQRRTGMTNEQFVNGVQYDADNNIEIDRYGVQAGAGYGFGMAEVGLTAGYANAQANGDGEFDADGWNIGIYGRYGGLTGFHAEALFKHDAYDVSFDGLFDGNDVDASSTGVDGSIGYRMAVGVVPSLDLFAGVSHVWSDMDSVSAFGFGYEFDDMTSTRGRLGLRGNFGGLYNPYLSLTGYHEFDGDGDVILTNGAFSSGLSSTGKGSWARLEGGLAGGQGTYGLNVAGWVDLGDTRGAGIRAGFRF